VCGVAPVAPVGEAPVVDAECRHDGEPAAGPDQAGQLAEDSMWSVQMLGHLGQRDEVVAPLECCRIRPEERIVEPDPVPGRLEHRRQRRARAAAEIETLARSVEHLQER